MPCRCLVVVVAIAAALTAVLTAATMVASAGDDVVAQPDAVVVLGGGHGERYDLGRALADEHDVPLVLSWTAIAVAAEQGARCDDDGLWCVFPDPTTTHGEARLIAVLADEHGFDEVAVVTTRFHVGRTRLLVGQCLDDHASVVGADADAPLPAQAYRVVREAYATLAALTVRRAC